MNVGDSLKNICDYIADNDNILKKITAEGSEYLLNIEMWTAENVTLKTSGCTKINFSDDPADDFNSSSVPGDFLFYNS